MQKCLEAAAVAILMVAAAARADAAAPATDAFTTACMARSGQSLSVCSCQSGLAKASFTASEQRAAIIGMSDTNALRGLVQKMGPTRGKQFLAKMQALSIRARQQCF